SLDLRPGDLEEAAEETVHALRPEALREPRRVDDVAEEDRHRPVLALGSRPLDGLGAVRRLGRGRRWLARGCERRAAGAAETPARVDPAAAGWTGRRERSAAVLAEPSAVRVR